MKKKVSKKKASVEDESQNQYKIETLNENEREKKKKELLNKFASKGYYRYDRYASSSKNLTESDEIPKRIQLTDLCILLQEFSRRSMNWPLIKIGCIQHQKTAYEYIDFINKNVTKNRKIDIPTEVIDLLNIYGNEIILAGGI